ncbi:hypothetical protein [Rubrivirga sp.]|uniref:hypothetical protein n=1 Tax=Rubrivirga sp. TaxID=1885344 RepID=UPI003B51F4E1
MRLAAVLLAAVVLSGCFQVASVITVRADGSAMIRDDVTLSGMALLAFEEAGADGPALFSRNDMVRRARALGEGVRLVSFETRDDGYAAVYAVDDVRRIAYAAPSAGEGSDAGETVALSFGFDEGDPSVLLAFVPKPPAQKRTEPPAELDMGGQEQALEMARGFLANARMTVAIEIEGDLVDTNAPAVDGSRVTVYDVPFDVLLDAMAENPALGAGGPPDPAAVLSTLRTVEGLTIPAPGTIRVRFR